MAFIGTRHHYFTDNYFASKVRLVKATVFPVVMDGCESWAIKKAEHWRIDAFELCCWRRLLRVSWTAKRSHQSILKEISPEYALEGIDAEAETLILWPPDAKSWLIRKDPDAEKDWRQEEKGMTEGVAVGWHHRLDGHECGQALGVGWWAGRSGVLQSMGLQRARHDWMTELNWTDFVKLFGKDLTTFNTKFICKEGIKFLMLVEIEVLS